MTTFAATDPTRRSMRRDHAAEGSIEEGLQHRQDMATLNTLLADLPQREHELIALKFGAGLTNRAIASLMKLGESNVGTILERVTRKLRERWEMND